MQTEIVNNSREARPSEKAIECHPHQWFRFTLLRLVHRATSGGSSKSKDSKYNDDKRTCKAYSDYGMNKFPLCLTTDDLRGQGRCASVYRAGLLAIDLSL